MRKEIEDWLLGPMDFKEGIVIFRQFCGARKRNLSLVIERRTNKILLEVEMKKLLGIPNSDIFTQKVSNKELIDKHFKRISNKVQKYNVNAREDSIIAACKAKIEGMARDLDIFRNNLVELGESNEAEVVAKREEFTVKITEMGKQYGELYELKEEYFLLKSTVCEASEYKKIDDCLRGIESYIKSLDVNEVPEEKSGLSSLSDIDLLKKRNSSRSIITRYQNKLKYGVENVLEEENPMPAGPKREKLEAKLAAKLEDLAAFDAEIDKRENDKANA